MHQSYQQVNRLQFNKLSILPPYQSTSFSKGYQQAGKYSIFPFQHSKALQTPLLTLWNKKVTNRSQRIYCISKQNIYFCINHDATDTKNRDTWPS